MSGLLERIVRRRRASASSRLGPPAGSDSQYLFVEQSANGADAGLTHGVNGSLPADAPPDVTAVVQTVVWTPDAGAAPTSETPGAVDEDRDKEEVGARVSEVEAVPAEEAPEPEAPEPEPAAEVGPAPEAIPELAPVPEVEAAPAEPETTPAFAEPEAAPAEPEATPAEPKPTPEPAPGFVWRGRIRRRYRYLRQVREVQLRDIGGFMLELHRFGRERPDLVKAKLTGAAATDVELRALQRALGERQPLRELREAGIGGACDNCGAVHGSSDRFCASCGEPISRGEDSAEEDGEPGPAS
jgi:hypothetical protein